MGPCARERATWCRLAVVVLSFSLLGCFAADASATPLGDIAEYSSGLPATSDPDRIAPGPEGNLWFTDSGTPAAIGRITTSGAITEFSAGLQSASKPYGIATGPEGNLWFTDRGSPSALGRITPAGTITEFSDGLPAESYLWSDIILGAEGDLWFVDQGGIGAFGRVTPAGQITESEDRRWPFAIAQGPEGDLWVAGRGIGFTGTITRVSAAGESTVFSTGLNKGADPMAIAPGPDGNMWFVDNGPTQAIGRITPAGQITEFSTGLSSKSWMLGIAAGPDGAMWFANAGAKTVGRITMDGEITEYPTGSNPDFGPDSVAPGADGNMWFTGESGGVGPILGKFGTGSPPALASDPVLAGSGEVGAEESCGDASWSSWAGKQPSSTLLAFDGYRWSLNGSPVANGKTFTPTATDAGQQLACEETVTYPQPFLVTAVATSATITVASPPPPVQAVKLSAVRESTTRWREGSRLASISHSKKHRHRKPAVGTTFSLSLNERATVRLEFYARVDGRRVRRTCKPLTRVDRSHAPCIRSVTAGHLTFTGHAGANNITFQGRISSTRRLTPGRYVAILNATGSDGQISTSPHLRFTIIKRRLRKRA